MSDGIVRAALRTLRRRVVDEVLLRFSPDFEPQDVETIRYASPYTLTSVHRLHALIEAVKHIARSGIAGDIVECGVWKGGSMMAVARTLQNLGQTERSLYLFDTFAGMTAPGEEDVSVGGTPAAQKFQRARHESGDGSEWCNASLSEVRAAMESTAYPPDRIILVEGKVEATIPARAPDRIALLRLDTDWYESTSHEMTHLYPRLAEGGVLIVDDYGHWLGARRAVDEYFAAHGVRMLLQRVDYTCRLGVKTARAEHIPLAERPLR
jgi:hypothetical protein